ncbi:MAG: hypothetical protein NTY90_04315 [Candidatus Micrarchaeota archaeon]|nr:hypothetical protein [Candidatus Micrarchaeota archaeon]
MPRMLKCALYLLSARVQLIASAGLALGGFFGALRFFEIIGLEFEQATGLFAALLLALLIVLLFKAFSLFLLVACDLVLLNSPKQELSVPAENVLARITRFLAEHKLEGIYLDKYSLGAERTVLAWLEKTFRLNTPSILFVWRPFAAVRFQQVRGGTRLWVYSEDSPLSRSLAKALETTIKYF